MKLVDKLYSLNIMVNNVLFVIRFVWLLMLLALNYNLYHLGFQLECSTSLHATSTF